MANKPKNIRIDFTGENGVKIGEDFDFVMWFNEDNEIQVNENFEFFVDIYTTDTNQKIDSFTYEITTADVHDFETGEDLLNQTIVIFSLSSAQTATKEKTTCKYDVKMVTDTGKVKYPVGVSFIEFLESLS